MSKICGVRLNPNGKVYSFAYTNQKIQEGDLVVVETQHGLKIGEIVTMNPESNGGHDGTRAVVRVATDRDFECDAENNELSKKAFKICKDKIEEMGLDMKLFKAEYTLDRSRIMFQYMSDQRVDFRELVKELVPSLKTRIEMIQVGPREHAKVVGGLGMCGRQFCCQRFMTVFEPVTIKMAKDQGLTSNPTKYSGNCGKLLCCIRHEETAYEYAQGIMPKNGAIVATPDGVGKTIITNMLKETCSVRVGTDSEFEIKSYHVSEVRTPTAEERNEYLAARKRERDEAEHEREASRAEKAPQTGDDIEETAETAPEITEKTTERKNGGERRKNDERHRDRRPARSERRPENKGEHRQTDGTADEQGQNNAKNRQNRRPHVKDRNMTNNANPKKRDGNKNRFTRKTKNGETSDKNEKRAEEQIK